MIFFNFKNCEFRHCFTFYWCGLCHWPKCYHVLNWFFLPKPCFLEFIWIFCHRNHFEINISHILSPNLTKWIPLNPAHQDLSSNTKGTFQFLRNFQLWFSLIFSEKIIQYSRTSTPQIKTTWNQTNAPLLLESFPKRSRTWSEASQFGGSHKYKQNKTNKLPYFIDKNPEWEPKLEQSLYEFLFQILELELKVLSNFSWKVRTSGNMSTPHPQKKQKNKMQWKGWEPQIGHATAQWNMRAEIPHHMLYFLQARWAPNHLFQHLFCAGKKEL